MAAPFQAAFALPRFDQSAMDGYCVRASDFQGALPITLPVVGESAAGRPSADALAPGTAMGISTGAKLPAGADAIVPVEWTTPSADGARVTIAQQPTAGRFIRRQGEDVADGAWLFGPGKRLSPAALAFLAMYNVPEIEVFRRPRVAVFTSGDEIKAFGEALRETDIVGVNVYYLEHELRAFGCDVRFFGIAPDEPAAWRAMFEDALGWGDAVVTTAGVSMGEHDVVGGCIRDLGGRVRFWKANVRPGKPMLVAEVGGKPFFGLPGNPVSVCANTEIFLKPFLRQALAIQPIETPRRAMTLVSECPRDKARLFFVFARSAVRDGREIVEALAHQSSGNLANPASANALIVAEPGPDAIAAGETVSVLPITPF